jgi:hypothetical protein
LLCRENAAQQNHHACGAFIRLRRGGFNKPCPKGKSRHGGIGPSTAFARHSLSEGGSPGDYQFLRKNIVKSAQ